MTAPSPDHAVAATAPSGLLCPTCGQGRLAVAPGPPDTVTTCPACGHRALSALVAEALWLQGEQTRLVTRLTWVQGRIEAGDLGVVGAAAASVGAAAAPVGAPTQRRAPVTAQGLLLGGGALLLVIAAVVFTAVAWNRIGAIGQVVAMVAVVSALSAASHAMRRSYRSTAEALATAAASVATVALLAAPRLGLGGDWMRRQGAAWAAIALLLVAGLSVVMARLGRLVAWRLATVVALGGSAVAATFALSGEEGGPQPLGVALLAVIAAGLLVWAARTDDAPRDAIYLGVCLGAVALALGVSDLDRTVLWALANAVTGASAAVVAVAPPPRQRARLLPHDRSWQAVAAVVAGLAWGQVVPRLGVRLIDSSEATLLVVGVTGCLGLLAGYLPTLRSAGQDRRRPAAAIAFAVVSWLLAYPAADAVVVATYQGRPWPEETTAAWANSLFWALLAVTLLLPALLTHNVWMPWPAAGAALLAMAFLLTDRNIETPEAYSLPFAVLLLGAGVLSVRNLRARTGRADSFAAAVRTGPTLLLAGPALAMALVPSAVVSWADGAEHDLARTVLVLVAGGACAVVGGMARLKAPLLLGSAALLLVALDQLVALADLVPRWVSLTLVAIALLAAGFSLEDLTRRGRLVRHAVHEFR